MSDTRPLSEFRFGLEWEPKLAEIMRRFPWSDEAFSMADPTLVCKICGRAAGSVNHVIEMSVSLIRQSEMVVGAHDFQPSPPWTEEQITASRDEWRRRMTGLPSDAAYEAWDRIHAQRRGRLDALFDKCAVKTRGDIEELGCTGCASFGLSIDDIQFLRIGLAGSGVGLPCFVPPDRYCLAHGVSGGLQDGQTARWTEHVEKVARPLTPGEAAHDKLVTAARKSEREHGAHSLLHGHTMPAGWKAEDEEADGVEGGAQVSEYEAQQDRLSDDLAAARAAAPRELLFVWKCDEHQKTDWGCRHCIAQAVIEGELMPSYAFETFVHDEAVEGGIGGKTFGTGATPEELLAEIAEADIEKAPKFDVYVRVATFTRKLARD